MDEGDWEKESKDFGSLLRLVFDCGLRMPVCPNLPEVSSSSVSDSVEVKLKMEGSITFGP